MELQSITLNVLQTSMAKIILINAKNGEHLILNAADNHLLLVVQRVLSFLRQLRNKMFVLHTQMM